MSRRPADLPVEALLTHLAATGSLEEACRATGTCSRTVHRRMRSDAALAAQINLVRQEAREVVEHGTPGAYNAGCRCTACRTANTLRHSQYVDRPTVTCPECGREVGYRGGRYAHITHSGDVCPGSERTSHFRSAS